MSQLPDESAQEPLAPKQQTLLKSSVLMASGTLVSRILGFVRSALLVAILGVTAGAADSFTIANTLPNMVYNLLAAGIVDAILIPQIVRALKGRSGSEYVNKLLTAAGTLLFGLTVVSMLAIPVIIEILAPTLTPEMRTLTITFSIICVPQIFFYGVYNLLGEVLNARGIFGPYMWAPVINNVVGIASLGLFLYLWGPSGDIRPAESMTPAQIGVVAGLSTVGVIAQALWLFIPMRKSGLKLRLNFHLKGTDFGSASKVAWWTFATLMVGQVGVISTSNLASRAGAWAQETGEIVAGTTAYQYAFMLYMVPQSLIAVTLATAIFTRFANDMSDGNMKGVANNFHRGVELILLLSFFVAAVLAVTATPVMQMIMPTFGAQAAEIYGNVLLALIFALPSAGMILMSQRVFFAMENARPVFLMSIVPILMQIIVGWTIYFLMDAYWWTIGASLGETVGRVLQGFIAIVWVGRVIPQVNIGRIASRYLRFAFAFLVSGGVGYFVMRFVGATSSFDSSFGRFFDSMWKVAVVGVVVAIVYFGILFWADPVGTRRIFDALIARVYPKASTGPVLDPGVEVDSEQELEDALEQSTDVDSEDSEEEDVHSFGVMPSAWTQEPPSWDDILPGEGAGIALSRSLSTPDLSSTGAIPLLSGRPRRRSHDNAQPDVGTVDVATDEHTPSDEEETDPAADLSDSDFSEETVASVVMDEGDDAGSNEAGYGDEDALDVDALESTFPEVGLSEQFLTLLRAREEHADGTFDTSRVDVDSTNVEKQEKVMPQNAEPSGSGNSQRFDPTIPALILGLLLVVVAGAVAFKNLLPSGASDFFAELSPALPQSSQSDDSTQSGEGDPSSPPAVAAPVVASATIFSWGDDEGDHPELATALLDSDPSTNWRSRYFMVNQFTEGTEISILVTLAEPAVVSEVALSVLGSGGEVTVTNASDGNPRTGDVLAVAPITSDTVIKLAQPTEMSAIGLVFNTLPTDDEGMYRAKVAELYVR